MNFVSLLFFHVSVAWDLLESMQTLGYKGKKISESNNVHLIMEGLTVLLLQGDDDNFVFTYSSTLTFHGCLFLSAHICKPFHEPHTVKYLVERQI